jgi:hypothetical protein
MQCLDHSTEICCALWSYNGNSLYLRLDVKPHTCWVLDNNLLISISSNQMLFFSEKQEKHRTYHVLVITFIYKTCYNFKQNTAALTPYT